MKWALALLATTIAAVGVVLVLSAPMPAVRPLPRLESAAAPLPADHQALAEANRRAEAIRSFHADVHGSVGGRISISLSGQMTYEKPKNFKLDLSSLRGWEVEIGSNPSDFWFRSRSARPHSLQFGSHDRVGLAGLKPGLHPDWMIGCLGLDPITPGPNAVLEDWNSLLRVRWEEKNPLRGHITRAVAVDRASCRVVGHYVYDQGGEPMSSVEVRWANDLPSEYVICWVDPQTGPATLRWSLSRVAANRPVDPGLFRLPADRRGAVNLTD